MDQRIIELLNQSPTPYHYVAKARELLLQAGFVELNEKEEWKTIPQKFFFVQDEATIFACNIKDLKSGVILATADDGSCFKLKPKTFQTKADVDQARIAPSGNGSYWTWLDRELCLAGRIVYNTPEGLKSKLIRTEKPIAVIPSLAIHLERSQMTNPKWNLEDHFVPILSLSSSCNVIDSTNSPSILETIQEDVVSSDLSFIDSNPTQLIGTKKEILAGMNLSSRSGAVAGLIAFLESEPKQGTNIFCSYSTSYRNDSMRGGASGVTLPWLIERLGLQKAYLVVNENYSGFGDKVHMKSNTDQTLNISLFEQLIARQLLDANRVLTSVTSSSPQSMGTKLISVTGLPAVVIGIPIQSMNSIRENCQIDAVLDLESKFAKAYDVCHTFDLV